MGDKERGRPPPRQPSPSGRGLPPSQGGQRRRCRGTRPRLGLVCAVGVNHETRRRAWRRSNSGRRRKAAERHAGVEEGSDGCIERCRQRPTVLPADLNGDGDQAPRMMPEPHQALDEAPHEVGALVAQGRGGADRWAPVDRDDEGLCVLAAASSDRGTDHTDGNVGASLRR